MKKNSEKKKINNNIKENSNINDNSNELFKFKSNVLKHDLYLENKIKKMVNKTKTRKIIFEKISFLDTIESYFCSKKSKIKLINISDDLVKKDLCVDNMLGRLYELEELFYLIFKKKLSKLNLHINTNFRTIFNYINEFDKESKRKKNDQNKKNIEIIEKNKIDNTLNI